MSNVPYQVTIVSHTHWDREWYQPFQLFRFRLVELIDRLLQILDEHPDYHSFLLDGQTIVLEDYLEIRPEREADLRRHIAQGRIWIGPWHVLPDEFLVSPEATVRNLLLGARVCARFGARLPVGYTPDAFGHIGQLPQILAGCGLEAAALQRGLSDEPTELWWESPDGTRLLTIYFRAGYGNLAWVPTFADGFLQAVQRQIGELAPHAHTRHLLLLNGTDHMLPQPELPDLIAVAGQRLADRAVIEQGTLPGYVAAVRAALGDNADIPVVTGELRCPKRWPVLPGVYSARMWIKQRNHACETALERYAEPISAIARLAGDIERTGELWRAWRHLIENHPHDSICGCSVDQVHAEMRTRFDWSEQIANAVAKAGLRYLAAQVDGSLLPAPPSAPDPHPPTHTVASAKSDWAVLVYNPVPGRQTGPVKITVPWAGPGRSYMLLNQDGEAVPYRILGGEEIVLESRDIKPDELSALLDQIEIGFYKGRLIGNVNVWIGEEDARLELVLPEYHTGEIGDFAQLVKTLRTDPRLRATRQYHLTAYLADNYRLAFVAHDVPGVGYAVYRLTSWPRDSNAGSPVLSLATPTRAATIENEWFVVEVDPCDGTLRLVDKSTGQVFSGLNCFQDGGDRGDEYNYCPPAQDTLIATPATPPVIERSNEGPHGQTLLLKAKYAIPKDLTADRGARSSEFVELPITCRVCLMPGTRRIDIRTELENRAENHRLRVLFPTSVESDRAIVDGHFDRLERGPAIPPNTTGWAERPAPTAAQRAFTAVEQDGKGILVAVRGLPEYELVPGEPGSTLALTLLRAIGWLSRDDLDCRPGHAGPERATPGAQCLGSSVFEYSLVPFGDAFGIDSAAREAYAFVAPLRGVAVEASAGSLPPSLEILSLEPAELVLTTIKPAESGEGTIVRFYNSSNDIVSGRLSFEFSVNRVTPVSFLEEPIGAAFGPGKGKAIPVEVPPKRIVTLHLL